jgi:hypothetical protein
MLELVTAGSGSRSLRSTLRPLPPLPGAQNQKPDTTLQLTPILCLAAQQCHRLKKEAFGNETTIYKVPRYRHHA